MTCVPQSEDTHEREREKKVSVVPSTLHNTHAHKDVVNNTTRSRFGVADTHFQENVLPMLQFHALEPRPRPPVVTPAPGRHTETLIAAGDATHLIMTRTMTADQLRSLYALDPVSCRTEAWRKVKITFTLKGKVLLASQPVRIVSRKSYSTPSPSSSMCLVPLGRNDFQNIHLSCHCRITTAGSSSGVCQKNVLNFGLYTSEM